MNINTNNKYFILLFDPDKFDISSKSACNNSKGLSFGKNLLGKIFLSVLHIYIVDIHSVFNPIFYCQQWYIIAVTFKSFIMFSAEVKPSFGS